jgi:hypothetical protein
MTSRGNAPQDDFRRLAAQFPAWDPRNFVELLQRICELARTERGEVMLHLLGANAYGQVLFHFDGKGGVALDMARSSCTRRTVELARALRLLLDDRFSLVGGDNACA